MPAVLGTEPPFELAGLRRRLGVHGVHLRDPAQRWCDGQLDALAARLTEARDRLRPSRTVLVGNSAGAYAALALGALLDADEVLAVVLAVVLALVPRSGLSEAVSAAVGDDRLVHLRRAADHPYDDLVPLLREQAAHRPAGPYRTRSRVLHALDNALDTAHAARLAGLPELVVPAYPRGDHQLARVLRASGELDHLVAAALAAKGAPVDTSRAGWLRDLQAPDGSGRSSLTAALGLSAGAEGLTPVERALLPGGQGDRPPYVVLVPTASGDGDELMERFRDLVAAEGAEPHVLSLFRRTEAPFGNVLDHADLVYVTGGAVANLAALWRLHGLDEELVRAWRRERAAAVFCAGRLVRQLADDDASRVVRVGGRGCWSAAGAARGGRVSRPAGCAVGRSLGASPRVTAARTARPHVPRGLDNRTPPG